MSKNEIVKLNPKDYGIQESKAKDISDMFTPMLDEMVELEKEYNVIINEAMTPVLCDKAKALRTKYVKVRTSTAKIHQELKSFYLKGGRFVDGWKNAQIMASEGIENNLAKIEKHYEILEKERIDKLQTERHAQLSAYELEVVPENLGEMPDSVWGNFLIGAKTSCELKKEAEEKAQKEAEEKERKEKIKNTRLIETASLSKFIPKYETLVLEDINDLTYEKMLTNARTSSNKYKKEQEKIILDNMKLRRQQTENALKLKKEQDAKEKLQKAESDRIAKENELEKEQTDKLEAIANASDKEKINKLHEDIGNLDIPETKNIYYQDIVGNVEIMLEKIQTYISDNNK